MRNIQTILNLALSTGRYNSSRYMCNVMHDMQESGIITGIEEERTIRIIGAFVAKNSGGSTTLNSAIRATKWCALADYPSISSVEVNHLKIAIYSNWKKRQKILETGPSHPLAAKIASN